MNTSRLLRCAVAVIAAAGLAAPLPASTGGQSSTARKKGLESQQKDLQKQIGKLSADLEKRRARKKAEEEAAKTAGAALTASNKKLARISSARKKNEDDLAYIRRQSDKVAGHLEDARRDMATTARVRYIYANKSPWGEVLASGAAPSQVNQGTAYLAYLAVSHKERADTLEERQGELETKEKEAVKRNRSLSASAASEKTSNRKLAAEQERHKANSAELGKQIATREQRIAELRRDQKRLSSLITQINAAIATEAKAERERKAAEAKKQSGKKKTQQAESGGSRGGADAATRFSRLRGTLTKPVQGTIEGRFGRSRGGAGTWQGLFFKAPEGSRVAAAAAGKVVYSGELRGYGNLVILDHGENYLSIYAYNRFLEKRQGDQVRAGDTIARSGTGASGNTPGLYFEIRYKGRPIDPAGWLR